LALQALSEHALGLVQASRLDGGRHGVEHQRDARHRLDGPVVEEQRQPAALLLLGGHDEIGHARPLCLALASLCERLLAAAALGENEVDAQGAGGDDRGGEPTPGEDLGVERQSGHADEGRRSHGDDQRRGASR
jgi:hypothetical protein